MITEKPSLSGNYITIMLMVVMWQLAIGYSNTLVNTVYSTGILINASRVESTWEQRLQQNYYGLYCLGHCVVGAYTMLYSYYGSAQGLIVIHMYMWGCRGTYLVQLVWSSGKAFADSETL